MESANSYSYTAISSTATDYTGERCKKCGKWIWYTGVGINEELCQCWRTDSGWWVKKYNGEVPYKPTADEQLARIVELLERIAIALEAKNE